MQGFFEEFCDVVKVVIIQKWFSEIWLHTRYESRANWESFYILGYLLEHIVKTWRFGNFLSFEIWQIWVIFFHKDPLGRNHILQVEIQQKRWCFQVKDDSSKWDSWFLCWECNPNPFKCPSTEANHDTLHTHCFNKCWLVIAFLTQVNRPGPGLGINNPTAGKFLETASLVVFWREELHSVLVLGFC
jgi:hypothetical protein